MLADTGQDIGQLAPALLDAGASHVSLACDTRADEYAVLSERADDVQKLAVHTLPWTVDAFSERVVYCDQVYF